MTVLFVNACIRGDDSRTLKLCREYLDGLSSIHEVDLGRHDSRLAPLTAETVAYRNQLQIAGKFDDPLFDFAKQFAEADEIVIGAPYWDLSFPSMLKVYIENVSVCDITFSLTDQGAYVGRCQAKSITYITTCGGTFKGANFGYEYICGIAKMFGIPEVRFVGAQGLDVVGCDIEAALDEGRRQIAQLKTADENTRQQQ